MTGEPWDLVLTGHRVAQAVIMLNSQTATVGMVPMLIHQLANGELALAKESVWAIAPPIGNSSWARGTSIFCIEYSDFTGDDTVYPGTFRTYEKHIVTQVFGAKPPDDSCLAEMKIAFADPE